MVGSPSVGTQRHVRLALAAAAALGRVAPTGPSPPEASTQGRGHETHQDVVR